jgi:hypothetical protein
MVVVEISCIRGSRTSFLMGGSIAPGIAARDIHVMGVVPEKTA